MSDIQQHQEAAAETPPVEERIDVRVGTVQGTVERVTEIPVKDEDFYLLDMQVVVPDAREDAQVSVKVREDFGEAPTIKKGDTIRATGLLVFDAWAANDNEPDGPQQTRISIQPRPDRDGHRLKVVSPGSGFLEGRLTGEIVHVGEIRLGGRRNTPFLDLFVCPYDRNQQGEVVRWPSYLVTLVGSQADRFVGEVGDRVDIRGQIRNERWSDDKKDGIERRAGSIMVDREGKVEIESDEPLQAA